MRLVIPHPTNEDLANQVNETGQKVIAIISDCPPAEAMLVLIGVLASAMKSLNMARDSVVKALDATLAELEDSNH